jgi:hypothetical protein
MACQPLAELFLESASSGSVLRLVTNQDTIADQAWLKRDAFLRMGHGVSAFEVVWKPGEGEEVVTRYSPDLS